MNHKQAILDVIAAINTQAQPGNIERIVLRVDPLDNNPVFIYPDDEANLGRHAASFFDCGGVHSSEVSWDWYYTTKALSQVKDSAVFLAQLDRLMQHRATSYIDQANIPTPRIYARMPNRR